MKEVNKDVRLVYLQHRVRLRVGQWKEVRRVAAAERDVFWSTDVQLPNVSQFFSRVVYKGAGLIPTWGGHTQKMGKRLNQSKDESLFRHRLSTCGHLCICYIHRDNSRLGCGRGGGGCRAQHASCFSFPLLWCRPSRSPMSTNRKWAKGDPTGGKWLHPPEAPVFSFDLDEEKIDRTDGQL